MSKTKPVDTDMKGMEAMERPERTWLPWKDITREEAYDQVMEHLYAESRWADAVVRNIKMLREIQSAHSVSLQKIDHGETVTKNNFRELERKFADVNALLKDSSSFRHATNANMAVINSQFQSINQALQVLSKAQEADNRNFEFIRRRFQAEDLERENAGRASAGSIVHIAMKDSAMGTNVPAEQASHTAGDGSTAEP